MGSFHVPRTTRLWRPRSRRSRIRPLAVAAAVLAALMLVGGGIRTAAYAATDAPYGGTPAAVPGTIQAANYDTGGQGVAYNVGTVYGTADSYRSDGVDLEATTDPPRRLRHRLDRGRAVVQLHGQRRHGRNVRRQPAARRTDRRHRRAAHIQRRGY